MFAIKRYCITIKINSCMIILWLLLLYNGYFFESLLSVVIILLHEIAHLFVASSYGLKAKEIELFPFGGVAKLEGIIGPDPKEEIKICIAGPLLNLGLVFFFVVLRNIFSSSYIIDFLIKGNFIMFIFNIVPIFPLDGGKILRAILSYFLGYKKATIMMTRATYVIATIIIIIGLIRTYYDDNGVYIVTLATFILIAAKNERKMAAFVFIRNIVVRKRDFMKRKVMKTHLLVCLNSVTAKEILDYFLPNKYHIIIVIDEDGNSEGKITEIELINAILLKGIDIPLENLLINDKKW